MIADCPGIVWVTGVGTSAAMGIRFEQILTDCGVRSIFLSSEIGLHGHSGKMKPRELLLALSRGAESREVNQMVEVAQRLGLKIVALVHDLDSTLIRLSSLSLPVRSPVELELGG
jgi:arabinose-5-phosphate isomerase